MLSAKNNEEMSKIIKKNIPSTVTINLRETLTPTEASTAAEIWVLRMFNNHIVVASQRVSQYEYKFIFADGSRVWDAKPFLLDRDEIVSVKIEGVTYKAKGATLQSSEKEL
ncbi:unnamed protein product [Soboliphyme baturini]|uniref:AMPK1_CBM domain-containing protein n=1 Tax=Soboliphyme baturini TaxID=241478 RepID=A0A183IZH5_9BILA|nr:unnamed protein product [Soboliphyme baturini]